MLGRHILNSPEVSLGHKETGFRAGKEGNRVCIIPNGNTAQVSSSSPIKGYWGQEPQSLEDVSRLSDYQQPANRSLMLAPVFIPETSEFHQSPEPTSQ